MYCQNCGKKLDDYEKYCSRCGTQSGIVIAENTNNLKMVNKRHVGRNITLCTIGIAIILCIFGLLIWKIHSFTLKETNDNSNDIKSHYFNSSQESKMQDSIKPANGSKEIKYFTENEIKDMMVVIIDQIKKSSCISTVYSVDEEQNAVYKVSSTLSAHNSGLGYIKVITPTQHLEVIEENDYLYADWSVAEEFVKERVVEEKIVEEVAEEEFSSTDYYDGERYHSLYKAELTSVGKANNREDTDSHDFFESNYDLNEVRVINQKEMNGYTIVTVAMRDNGENECHILLYIKDGIIKKILTPVNLSSLFSNLYDEKSIPHSFTEVYNVIYIDVNVDVPTDVPEYFDSVEFSDDTMVSLSVAFSMMGMAYGILTEITEENITANVHTGEWAANEGGLTIDEVKQIRELLDVSNTYLSNDDSANERNDSDRSNISETSQVLKVEGYVELKQNRADDVIGGYDYDYYILRFDAAKDLWVEGFEGDHYTEYGVSEISIVATTEEDLNIYMGRRISCTMEAFVTPQGQLVGRVSDIEIV